MNMKNKYTEALEARGVDAELIYYDITDSTNTRARELARGRSERGPVILVAEEQSAGRGRRGRSFFSGRGAGLYVSFLLYPEDRGADVTSMTAFAAVALRRAIARLTGLRADIKWVNDLYADGKKLAGILAEGEMGAYGKMTALAVGMGINIYKTAYPEEISDIATSIENACGKRVDRAELLAELALEMLRADRSESAVLEEYREASFLIGREVTVHTASGSYPARAVELSPDFSLIVEREDGERLRLFTGEVSVKI